MSARSDKEIRSAVRRRRSAPRRDYRWRGPGPREEQTCNRGLAEHAALPRMIAEVMASVSAILEVHMRALDLTDENARVERGAYERLVDPARSGG